MKTNFTKKLIAFVSIGAIATVLGGIICNYLRPASSLESYIIVNKTKIDEDWKKENLGLNPDYNYSNDDCSIKIDLSKISQDDYKKVADWLEKNSEKICYEESYQYIEKNHKVDDLDKIRKIINGKENKTITLEEFINKLNSIDTTKPPFQDRLYGNYINFIQETNPTDGKKEIKYNFKTLYEVGDISISVPTLKSIIYENQILLADYKNYTITLSMDDTEKQIALILGKNGTSKVKIYNYSTDPTKPTTMMLNFLVY